MLERAFNNAIERGLVRRCIEGGAAMEFGGNADIERALVGFFRWSALLSTEIEVCIDRVVKVIDQFLNGLTFVGNQGANTHDFSEKNGVFLRKLDAADIAFIFHGIAQINPSCSKISMSCLI